MTSPLDERRLLRMATSPRVAGPLLEQALGLPPGDGRLCRVLDTRYEPGVRCAILYDLPSGWVSGSLEWASAHPLASPSVFLPELQLWVGPFGSDPHLPGMSIALEGDRLWTLAASCLAGRSSAEVRLLRSRVTPVRYRPGIRCTWLAEFWFHARGGGIHRRSCFVKAYRADGEMAIVTRAMRQLTSALGSGPLRLAPVVAEAPRHELLLQGALSGAPLEGFLVGKPDSVRRGEPRGRAGVLASARALAAIHSSGVSVPRMRSSHEELAELLDRSARTERSGSGGGWVKLADDLSEHAQRLEGWGAHVVFTHGDCKPTQMLLDDGSIAILDFDLCAMADPAADIGTYLATLRQMGLALALQARGVPVPDSGTFGLRQLEEHFLREYCRAARTASDFRLRATFYEAVALLRKGLRAFARSPRSPIATAQLDQARRCLGTLPPARPR